MNKSSSVIVCSRSVHEVHVGYQPWRCCPCMLIIISKTAGLSLAWQNFNIQLEQIDNSLYCNNVLSFCSENVLTTKCFYGNFIYFL